MKKGYSAMEVVMYTVLLVILVLVIIQIVIPRLSKVQELDRCPISSKVQCVDKFPKVEASDCKPGGVLNEYNCDKGKICCRVRDEIAKELEEIYNRKAPRECPEGWNVDDNEQCLCAHRQGETGNYEILKELENDINLYLNFGSISLDCIGTQEKTMFTDNPKTITGPRTKYCADIPEDFLYYINSGWEELEDVTKLCFEKNPNIRVEVEAVEFERYDPIHYRGKFSITKFQFDLFYSDIDHKNVNSVIFHFYNEDKSKAVAPIELDLSKEKADYECSFKSTKGECSFSDEDTFFAINALKDSDWMYNVVIKTESEEYESNRAKIVVTIKSPESV